MGFTDKEIVALNGAHTVGRSRPERSGFGKPETKYTVFNQLQLIQTDVFRATLVRLLKALLFHYLIISLTVCNTVDDLNVMP